MPSLQQLIQRELNPFDPATFRPGNFWQEDTHSEWDVATIHQDILFKVNQWLQRVEQEQQTRTLILAGDSGSGKSHLLSRLKRQLNPRAFFAYIGPWPDSQYIWRHVLHHTIDSLLQTPEGQTQSQLLLWLEGLVKAQRLDFGRWVLGKRQTFIRDLRAAYPTGIYNASEFFGVLYDLTNPDLYFTACDWLKGDNLDEDDLKALRVKYAIDSEDAAQKVLANIGKISRSTQPIVLCFDNLDNIPKSPQGSPDLQALFNVNTTFHNEKLKHFLIVISIITNTLKTNLNAIQPADRARVDDELRLHPILLEQAQSLWAYRLQPLHQKLKTPPAAAIAPLSSAWLEAKFPRGKALPRNVLRLGQQLIEHYKQAGTLPQPGDPEAASAGNLPLPVPPPPPLPAPSPTASAPHNVLASRTAKTIGTTSKSPVKSKTAARGSKKKSKSTSRSTRRPTSRQRQRSQVAASFDLIWLQALEKAQTKIQRLSDLSSPELIWRLREVLEVLALDSVKTPLLKSTKYSAYSLSYRQEPQAGMTGVVWSEDRNMTSFFHLMRACQKAIEARKCDQLFLIRSESVGKANSKGNQLYRQIFSYANALHIQADLRSVQCLEAYHSLVNAAAGSELVVREQVPTIAELQELMRGAQGLEQCALLQELELVTTSITAANQAATLLPVDAERYAKNLIVSQQLMGTQMLLETTKNQFPDLTEQQLTNLVTNLCQEPEIQILNPTAKPEEQLIHLVPAT
ncbi:MAG: P-loop NTPase fold protein [Cyanobacteria bacterium P01_H01_bin.121]